MQRLRCSRYLIHGAVLLMLAVVSFGCRKEQRYPGFTRIGGDGKVSYFVDASTIRRATGARQFSFVELIENPAGEYDVGEAMVDCDSLSLVAGEAGHYDREKHFISNTPQHTQSITSIAHFVCTQGKNSPLSTSPSNSDATIPTVQNLAAKQKAVAEQSARTLEQQKARQIAKAQEEVRAKEEQKEAQELAQSQAEYRAKKQQEQQIAQEQAEAQAEAQAKKRAEWDAQISNIKPHLDNALARLRSANDFWDKRDRQLASTPSLAATTPALLARDFDARMRARNKGVIELSSANNDGALCRTLFSEINSNNLRTQDNFNRLKSCVTKLVSDLDKLDSLK